MFVEAGDRIAAEKDIFESKAGTTRENYFLYGLRFKLTVRTSGTIRSIYLYSSDQQEDESNRFAMTNEGGGVYSYENTAGQGATALDVVSDEDADFEDGIKFYFRVKIAGEIDEIIIDRVFWVRNPPDIIFFTSAVVPYTAPYPVLVGALLVPVSIAQNAKNAAGVALRGGIETVQVFDTPGAPSGSHVIAVSETAVENLSSITLVDRSFAGAVPDFIPPPGAPDFSRYYHFVTFRLRAKQGSSYYLDVNVLLFAAKECAIDWGTYGYSSTSPDAPVAPGELNLLTFTSHPGLTQCTSYSVFTTDVTVNMYAHITWMRVYDAEVGGNLLGIAQCSATAQNQIRVNRSAFGGATTTPMSGWFELVELGPDRQSANRIEACVPQCYTPGDPYEIYDITGNGTKTITLTEDSGDVSVGSEIVIVKFDNKYGGVPTKEFVGTRTGDKTISFEITEDETGWWAIKIDGVIVTGFRQYKELTAYTLTARYGHNMFVISTDIYMFGGKDGDGNVYSDMYKLGYGDVWEAVSTTNDPPARMDAVSWVNGGYFYVFGGLSSSNTIFDDLWKFDPTTNAWTEITLASPKPSARAGSASVVLAGGQVLIYGGYTVPLPLVTGSQELWRLNVDNTFTQLSDSSSADRYPATVYLSLWGNYLYSCHFQDQIDYYDITGNSWAGASITIDVDLRNGNAGFTTIGSQYMYVLGGYLSDQTTESDNVYEIDVSSGICTKIGTLSKPIAHGAMVKRPSTNTCLFWGGYTTGHVLNEDFVEYEL